MGEKDAIFKEYASDNRRFADLFNYYLHAGEQVIDPDKLKPANVEHIVIFPEQEEINTTESSSDTSSSSTTESSSNQNDKKARKDRKRELLTRFRDLFKFAVYKHDDENSYLFLGIEEQSSPCAQMSVRLMMYDAMAYTAQTEGNLHDSFSELSDMSSNELVPVITLVVYFGQTKWTAPRSLHDMMPRLPDHLKKFVPNYEINLIEPLNMSENDYAQMQTNWNAVFEAFKAYVDNGPAGYYNYLLSHTRMADIDKADMNLLETMTNCHIQLDSDNGEEKMNMNAMMKEYIQNHDEKVIKDATPQIIKDATPQIIKDATPQIIKDATPQIIEAAQLRVIDASMRIARNLMKTGLSVEEISEATQLPIEKIKALKKEPLE